LRTTFGLELEGEKDSKVSKYGWSEMRKTSTITIRMTGGNWESSEEKIKGMNQHKYEI